MDLESYFTVHAPDDIRVRGTRVGIETILYDHIHRCRTPEQIAADYPSVTLEQVYATITFYLHNKERITAYLTNWLEDAQLRRAEQNANPPPVIVKLREIAAERRARASTA